MQLETQTNKLKLTLANSSLLSLKCHVSLSFVIKMRKMTKLRQKLQITVWHEIFAGSNFCDFPAIRRKNKLPIKISSNIFLAKIYCRVIHQSIPAAPSLPAPRSTMGHLPEAFANFALHGSPAFANPGLLTRTRFRNITTQRILLEKQADWPLCQGRQKIEEVCIGMFSILCMYFFIAYQAGIT